MIPISTYEYQDAPVSFADDAFVNLTELCAAFNKRPSHFLDLKSTADYMAALAADTGLAATSKVDLNCRDSRQLKSSGESLLITSEGRYGSGTWAHPDLAIECARWLSPAFAIWCNRIIRALLAGRVYATAEDKPALKRIEAGIEDTRQLLVTKVARYWQAQEIPGQYAVRVYVEAAGIKQEEVKHLALSTLMRHRRAAYDFPTGYCRMIRNFGAGKCRQRPSGWQRVRTWPPEHIAAALRELGHEFREPDAMALAAAEEKFLYIAEIRRRRKAITAPVADQVMRGQAQLDFDHSSAVPV
jgi:hypothetical protein